MNDPSERVNSRMEGLLSRLSVPVLVAVGVLVAAGVGGGGYYVYRTYDYIQHDNDFCMSCHLMAAPYEQFAQSAHRGLGCKACHQPTLLARSQMALTQVLENPEELSVHAEVSNERCAECHIEGDPEKWRLIANSVGHRVHLESDDPVLSGLQCVECHSTSVHEFAPIDRTCAQSDCHDDKVIQLAAMSDLTIHCAACHTFVAPVREAPEGTTPVMSGMDAAILPDQEECFSCHAMRTLAEMPADDPHQGVCAACHNPHEQSTPAEAAGSCATADCHSDVRSITPFHEGVEAVVLDDCLYCHQAHDFSIDGNDCLACHQGVPDDDFTVPSRASGRDEAHPTVPLGGPDSVADPDGSVPMMGFGIGWWAHQSLGSPEFLHSEHRGVECGNCHQSSESHGQLVVSTLSDCRDCHHAEPVSRDCARCHTPADAPGGVSSIRRNFTLSVGTSGPRRMDFAHQPHESVDCGACHTQGLALDGSGADCAGCHEDHHQATAECASCHDRAPTSAHPAAEAHVTCMGSGCHTDPPIQGVPRTREVCLGCHQDLGDHRPGRTCAECHTLPDPRAR